MRSLIPDIGSEVRVAGSEVTAALKHHQVAFLGRPLKRAASEAFRTAHVKNVRTAAVKHMQMNRQDIGHLGCSAGQSRVFFPSHVCEGPGANYFARYSRARVIGVCSTPWGVVHADHF